VTKRRNARLPQLKEVCRNKREEKTASRSSPVDEGTSRRMHSPDNPWSRNVLSLWFKVPLETIASNSSYGG